MDDHAPGSLVGGTLPLGLKRWPLGGSGSAMLSCVSVTTESQPRRTLGARGGHRTGVALAGGRR